MNTFWRLDLSRPEDKRSWEELEPIPGPARILPAAAAQNGDCYLASGARLVPDDSGQVTREYLTDAYCHEAKSMWRSIAASPHPVVAAAATAVGNSHVLVFDCRSHHVCLGSVPINNPTPRMALITDPNNTPTFAVLSTSS